MFYTLLKINLVNIVPTLNTLKVISVGIIRVEQTVLIKVRHERVGWNWCARDVCNSDQHYSPIMMLSMVYCAIFTSKDDNITNTSQTGRGNFYSPCTWIDGLCVETWLTQLMSLIKYKKVWQVWNLLWPYEANSDKSFNLNIYSSLKDLFLKYTQRKLNMSTNCLGKHRQKKAVTEIQGQGKIREYNYAAFSETELEITNSTSFYAAFFQDFSSVTLALPL
jgi:hypothetical protein